MQGSEIDQDTFNGQLWAIQIVRDTQRGVRNNVTK